MESWSVVERRPMVIFTKARLGLGSDPWFVLFIYARDGAVERLVSASNWGELRRCVS
jgi:hypothetical protein